MTVRDLYLVLVQGKIVIKDREGNIICKTENGVEARCCFKLLKENDVLDDEIDYIEVANDIAYITVK